jgi:deoxyribonuclease-4
MGADRVVIHTGALQKRSRAEALATAKGCFRMLRRRCDDQGYGNILLCPETMGKINQLGDLEEVLALCTVAEGLLPCVDFGHLYARSLGALNGREACEQMLLRMEEVLGAERASGFHAHFSKIQFTPKGGEYKHLRFCDPGWGPDFLPLGEAIGVRGWHPTLICESAGTQSEDALEMKQTYLASLHKK